MKLGELEDKEPILNNILNILLVKQSTKIQPAVLQNLFVDFGYQNG